MKILLAQINTTVSALEANTRAMLDALVGGRALGADLVVFPELTLTGYPPKDLLERSYFVRENLACMKRVVAATGAGAGADAGKSIGAIFGFVDPNTTGPGQGLFNAAAVADGGRLLGVYRKRLLPTYDVFDEARYFDAGASDERVFEFRGRRIGVSICEDIWNDELHWSRRRYSDDPIAQLAAQGIDLLINIGASPFTLGKRETKRAMLAHSARRHGVPLVHVNLAGANDELIFDGWSNVFGANGEIAAQARDFAEDFVVAEVGEPGGVIQGEVHDTAAEPMERLRRALVLGIRDYVRKCGFKDVVLGLSGGIDSALVAALAAQALGPEHVLGVSMPSRYSSDGSKTDAAELAANLGIRFDMIPIESMFGSALETLAPHFAGRPSDVAEENLQSRLRGLILMAISNKFGGLVLTTGNKSELAVGYATLYGDMCGGLAPIADVPKTMIYELARHLNSHATPRPPIPESTLTKPPSAELRPDQKDTDSLPPYDQLDPILNAYIERALSPEEIIAEGRDPAVVRRVVRMVDMAEYKRRQAAPALKVTSRAFGYGWRMPIARGSFSPSNP